MPPRPAPILPPILPTLEPQLACKGRGKEGAGRSVPRPCDAAPTCPCSPVCLCRTGARACTGGRQGRTTPTTRAGSEPVAWVCRALSRQQGTCARPSTPLHPALPGRLLRPFAPLPESLVEVFLYRKRRRGAGEIEGGEHWAGSWAAGGGGARRQQWPPSGLWPLGTFMRCTPHSI